MAVRVVESKPAAYGRAISQALDRWCASDIAWGKDDCLMALATVVQTVEGLDLAKPYRGKYRSQRGALRVLGAKGVPGALAKAARELGWKPLPPARCQNGALGYINTLTGPAGVVRMGNMWYGRVSTGFGSYPSSIVCKSWGYE